MPLSLSGCVLTSLLLEVHCSPRGFHRRTKGTDILLSEAKKRQTIGLLTKSLVEVRRSPAWEEMVNLAQENDINLAILVGGMLKSPIGFEAQANILYDLVSSSNIDGLIVTGGLGHYIGPEGLRHFCERFRPLPSVSLEVLLDGFPQDPPPLLFRNVRADEASGRRPRLPADCVRPRAADSKTGEVATAFLDSLSRFGIPFDPHLVARAPSSLLPAPMRCSCWWMSVVSPLTLWWQPMTLWQSMPCKHCKPAAFVCRKK